MKNEECLYFWKSLSFRIAKTTSPPEIENNVLSMNISPKVKSEVVIPILYHLRNKTFKAGSQIFINTDTIPDEDVTGNHMQVLSEIKNLFDEEDSEDEFDSDDESDCDTESDHFDDNIKDQDMDEKEKTEYECEKESFENNIRIHPCDLLLDYFQFFQYFKFYRGMKYIFRKICDLKNFDDVLKLLKQSVLRFENAEIQSLFRLQPQNEQQQQEKEKEEKQSLFESLDEIICLSTEYTLEEEIIYGDNPSLWISSRQKNKITDQQNQNLCFQSSITSLLFILSKKRYEEIFLENKLVNNFISERMHVLLSYFYLNDIKENEEMKVIFDHSDFKECNQKENSESIIQELMMQMIQSASSTTMIPFGSNLIIQTKDNQQIHCYAELLMFSSNYFYDLITKSIEQQQQKEEEEKLPSIYLPMKKKEIVYLFYLLFFTSFSQIEKIRDSFLDLPNTKKEQEQQEQEYSFRTFFKSFIHFRELLEEHSFSKYSNKQNFQKQIIPFDCLLFEKRVFYFIEKEIHRRSFSNLRKNFHTSFYLLEEDGKGVGTIEARLIENIQSRKTFDEVILERRQLEKWFEDSVDSHNFEKRLEKMEKENKNLTTENQQLRKEIEKNQKRLLMME